MKAKLAAFALLAVTFALSAHAGEVTVTPLAGYQFYDNKLDKLDPPGLDNTLIYGGTVGYRFTKNWAAELEYLHSSPDRSNTGGSGDDNFYDLNGLYEFSSYSHLQPYLLLGVGEQHLKVDGVLNNARDSVINAGAGIFYRVNDALRLRGEVRAVSDTDKRYTDGVALVGLEFSFGGSPSPQHHLAYMAEQATPPAAVEPAPPAPTPKPAQRRAEAAAPVPPLDSDHDGVPDSIDKCPNTPEGALVDANGCPKMITESIKQEVKVLFDNGKSVVKPEYHDEIKKVADIARQYPTAYIEIQGYTDNTGKAAKNVKLSQERADAVRSSLEKDFGIAASRLSAKGYGAANPVDSNKTAEGRAHNRRVIAVISAERKEVEMKKHHH